jgi:hypothetical protein
MFRVKMTAFWDIASCSLAEVLIALMMEEVHTSETSLIFYENARRYIPEGCHVYNYRRDNLICHVFPVHQYREVTFRNHSKPYLVGHIIKVTSHRT